MSHGARCQTRSRDHVRIRVVRSTRMADSVQSTAGASVRRSTIDAARRAAAATRHAGMRRARLTWSCIGTVSFAGVGAAGHQPMKSITSFHTKGTRICFGISLTGRHCASAAIRAKLRQRMGAGARDHDALNQFSRFLARFVNPAPESGNLPPIPAAFGEGGRSKV